MLARLGIVRAPDQDPEAIAAHSRAALDRPLRCQAELCVAVVRGEARLLGAFQRGRDLPHDRRLVRRGSGGPDVLVGEGTVHVALTLAHPAVLAAGDETRIVNRSVRPLLRSLGAAGALAHYFGRDWVSVAHRPAAWVGFAHDATTRRTLFEAFVAVRSPFALEARASFLGKEPGTLESILERVFDPDRIAERIVEAYARGHDAVTLAAPPAHELPEAIDLRADPPWAATGEAAIGVVGAGPDRHGVFRVGGDLLVSRDALLRLEAAAAAAGEADLDAVVDSALAAPGVALDGVRSLSTVRDVIAKARFGPGGAVNRSE